MEANAGGVGNFQAFTSIGTGYLIGDTCHVTQGANSTGTVTIWGYPIESYSSANFFTPKTYANCLSAGDTLVFLDGFKSLYGDGSNNKTSLEIPNSGSSGLPISYIARPGATATLGSQGTVNYGIRNGSLSSYFNVAGLILRIAIGSQTSGEGANLNGQGSNNFINIVNNKITCADCWASAAALSAGQNAGAEGPTSVFVKVLSNYITDASCELPGGVTAPGSPAGYSNKQYHNIYVVGDDVETGWNRISSTCAFNGIQINFGADNHTVGYTNFSAHDNDISEVNGAAINLATVDPSRGFVKVYNNIIHHSGIREANDSVGAPTNHTCIGSPAEGFSSIPGTAQIYNNSMFDCSSIQNTVSTGQGCFKFSSSSQPNLQYNLVNNICYQPTYTLAGSNTVWTNNSGGTTISGSNNDFFYAGGTPGNANTSLPAFGTSGMLNTDPEYTTSADGPWTNFLLQSSSPVLGAGTSSGAPTTDFRGKVRSSPPAMGALELFTQALAQVTYTEVATSNNTDSLGNTANKKTLGNVGTGCTGGTTITPVGFPVGQLYATSAIASAAITAGCATQGSVSATITGTGTTAVNNGNGSGGTDSPSAVTIAYGTSGSDSVCTGDTNNSLPTPYPRTFSQ